MKRDLLECKKKGKELVTSENPPCKENGNKKVYIAVMTELGSKKDLITLFIYTHFA